jgi:DNA-binding beta-propeller fold protein YncE
MQNKAGKMAAVVTGLLIAASVRAEDEQPLQRVATIELKGKAGTLDHLGADWKNSRLFIANQSNDTLDVVDVKNNKLVIQVSGQKQIHGIAYAADQDHIFVGNGEGVCNVLDGRGYKLLKSIPVPDADSVRYDPRTRHVFVAGDKRLAVIDAATLDLVTNIELPAPPHGFQIDSMSPHGYVNTGVPCQVTVVDTEKNQVVTGYPLGAHKGIGPLTLDVTDRRLFVGLRRDPRLAMLELDSGKEIASIPIPEGSDDKSFDADAKRIYISCSSGFVAVIHQIDADHYKPVATIATAPGAKTSAYNPTTKRLYVVVPRQPGKERPEVWVYQARD